ncbi:response regulator [Paenibacillus contaminans]|uniref:Two-component system response regulator n=1 Tax=Paenibacillus contaminans TaxID=450362 RepID=A0A329LW33_9BACL|nr:response regulator [Paenibacillus contaminans]RAV11904.1 two-component system response regulator [Paenibacillus contaminans]
MNLLIVEDEVRLRTSLANNIPWEDHGIEIVGLAGRGLEALHLYRRGKPDIVLLDIRIPEMDGIELAREMIKVNPLVKIIILSGYDNFSFAQSALEIGVSKYLLKPADDAEILQAVLDAAEQSRQELDRLYNQEALQQKWLQQLPNLQNSFFQNWMNGKYAAWEIGKYGGELQIDLPAEAQYAVVVLDMDPLSDEETRFNGKDVSLLQFSLNSIVREIMAGEHNVWVLTAQEGYTVLVFHSPLAEDSNGMMLAVNVAVANLLSKVKECLKLTASAGICGETCCPEQLHLIYAQAIRALQGRVVYGPDIAIPYKEQQQSVDTWSMLPNYEKNLEIAVETGDEEQAGQALQSVWESAVAKAGTVDDVQEWVLYFSSVLVRIIHRQGWRLKEVLGEDFEYLHHPQQLVTKEKIHAWLQRTVGRMIAYVRKQREAVDNQIVKKILQIVDKELHTELTLLTVADRLFVNSSYLSRLFKREMGTTFSAYVLEHKMERAKQLLQQGAKVSDASNQVGYKDVSYFTKVFRKFWGVTPGEVKR